MKIGKENRVCLQGDPTLAKTQVTYKSLKQSVGKNEEFFMIEYSGLCTEDPKPTAIISKVEELLNEFPKVCRA